MGRLIEAWLGPACFAGLALFAWLAVTAHRADRQRALVGLCREAVRLREGQEQLAAAGKPAPCLEQTRRAEAAFRALLR